MRLDILAARRRRRWTASLTQVPHDKISRDFEKPPRIIQTPEGTPTANPVLLIFGFDSPENYRHRLRYGPNSSYPNERLRPTTAEPARLRV